jgi:hypothetical protein
MQTPESPATSPGTAVELTGAQHPSIPSAPNVDGPTPQHTFIAQVEQDFDTLIAKVEAFLAGLKEHKAAHVASLKAVTPEVYDK